MALIAKFLPLILAAGWLFWVFTADTRTVRSFRRNSSPLTDWAILERIQQFERALDVRGLQVRILETPVVNAVAVSSGEVYITRGLYDAYLGGGLRRSEVMAVIAHEIGHVALGHVRRRMDQMRIETAGLAAAGFLLGRLLAGWLSLIAMIAVVFRSRMSRRDEFEADAFGVQLMARAEQDPRALIRALQKTEKMSGAAMSGPRRKPIRWLASHPATEDRVLALEGVIAALRDSRDGAAA